MIGEGSSEPLGATPMSGGVNFATFSSHATAIEICVFGPDDAAEERYLLPGRTGDVWHGFVPGLPEGSRYGLRAHGPFAPMSGHRFNPSKLLVDPYAVQIDRAFRLHQSMLPSGPRSSLAPTPDHRDTGAWMPKALIREPAPQRIGHRPIVPWGETVIYELHVRAFTKLNEVVPAELRGRLAALAHPAVLSYLSELGITTIEVMPLAAWVDEPHLGPLGLTNFWGYNPAVLMAPDPRLAPDGWREISETVATLASHGLETIVDVVLNHSGEGDEDGPMLSFRGLDNSVYYRLAPGRPDQYVNDTGTGNTLALDRPICVRLAMDALRCWVRRAGVHGFRFDLGTVAGRRDTGFDAAAPLLAAIQQDPELRELKLIMEPWDIGHGGYRLGQFPSVFAEWNDHFRDDVRRFWRGEGRMLGPLATRLAGSDDIFRAKRRPSRSINFVTAHDGFTLADLVSYEHKHNTPNGEKNRDGTDLNYSWSHGTEGETLSPNIRAARHRDQAALLATLLLARGTPMLGMGAERGHTQKGNNNAYCQDNRTTWIDWTDINPKLKQILQELTALRRGCQLLRDDHFLSGSPAAPHAPPDVTWHNAAGQPMSQDDWHDPDGAFLMMVLGSAEERAAILLHRGHAALNVQLPEERTGATWRPMFDSTGSLSLGQSQSGRLVCPARSVLLYRESPR